MLIGNSEILSALKVLASRGRVGNALLFAGPRGVGKGHFARAFAANLLGSLPHPDLVEMRPEGKSEFHPIDRVREFSEKVFLPPTVGRHKVFILHDADRMLPQSANALLKTIEEPSLDTVLILTSSQPERLLPTVTSRARTFHFHRVSTEEIKEFLIKVHGLSPERAEELAKESRGSPSRAVELITQEKCKIIDYLEHNFLRSVGSFSMLSDLAAKLDELIQDKEMETIPKDLTAFEKERLQKEREAVETHLLREKCGKVFDWILELYCGALLPNHLLLPPSRVLKAAGEAILSLERSTPPKIVLESFFLKLVEC